VLKAGSISTLDIIAGIKQKVIDVKASLPDALKIGFIGDQSLFVRASITGVLPMKASSRRCSPA
jgi:multidrug efflux pump subunit AcrB